ncbi:MAG: alpha/beta hydrolase [Planctomycetota bacterium]
MRRCALDVRALDDSEQQGTKDRYAVVCCLAGRVVTLLLLLIATQPPVVAEQLFQLRNGLVLKGLPVDLTSINQNAFTVGGTASGGARPVLMIDDGLTRIYLHRNAMLAVPPTDIAGVRATITFEQSVAESNRHVQGIGAILGVSGFTEYGRRKITVRGPSGGNLTIFQGITELNERYAELQGLKARPAFQWEMRVDTRSIPTETLNRIFARLINQEDLNSRFDVVRLYIAAERYEAAHAELRRIKNDFPDEPGIDQQLIAVTESQADQLLDLAIRRKEVGQYRLARSIVDRFPVQAVGGLMQQKVKGLSDELDSIDRQSRTLVAQLQSHVAELPDGDLVELGGVVEEVAAQLSGHSLDRLADYQRLGQADELPLSSRVSLAIGGWLLGSGSGEQNLKIVISLIKIRGLVKEYLSTADETRRKAILDELVNEEGAQPEYVSRLIAAMLPPLSLDPAGADETIPGFYRVTIDGGVAESADQATYDYVIQLPPEYDPRRRYPALVALPPIGLSLEDELTFWAGPFSARYQSRMGHASQNGFVVITPRWARSTQRTYAVTPREHARVLRALRHALRRTSIDTDRVFIAGHADGATAAWDIALAHPDLWAGMVSINGEPGDSPIGHYDQNARGDINGRGALPLYMVMGEKDGAPAPLIRNGAVMDKYMRNRFDAMVVMYRGHGRQYFADELPRIFQWMTRVSHRRGPPPSEIDAVTLRGGDRMFWWLELANVLPTVTVDPLLWKQAKRRRAAPVTAKVGDKNQLRIVQAPADAMTVWLAPKPYMNLDLAETVTIRSNRMGTKRFNYDGSLGVMLEDARQRADRKHVFWARVDLP